MGAGNILIIDDDENIREILTDHCAEICAQTFAVETLKEAFETIENESIHLVLLDMNLGGSSGLEFLRHFKNYFFRVPVLIISGVMDENLVTQALSSGATNIIHKPFEEHKVEEMLQPALVLGLEMRNALEDAHSKVFKKIQFSKMKYSTNSK